MKRTYYDILGVTKNAPQDEIKKAYYKLSKEFHPDINGGNEDMFKEISEAYNTLGNEEKRKEYDASLNPRPHNQFYDLYESMINVDVNVRINITIDEAYYGCKRTISYNGKTFVVNIPHGTTTGKTFRLKGKGKGIYKRNGEYKCGDILVHTTVIPSENMMLENDGTLYVMLGIDWILAILGGVAKLQIFDKTIDVTVPKYTQNGSSVYINGCGFPKFKKEGYGNIVVNFIIKMPNKLNDKQIKLMEQINELNPKQ